MLHWRRLQWLIHRDGGHDDSDDADYLFGWLSARLRILSTAYLIICSTDYQLTLLSAHVIVGSSDSVDLLIWFCTSGYLSYLLICVSNDLLICLSVCLFMWLTAYLIICLSAYLISYLYLIICLHDYETICSSDHLIVWSSDHLIISICDERFICWSDYLIFWWMLEAWCLMIDD